MPKITGEWIDPDDPRIKKALAKIEKQFKREKIDKLSLDIVIAEKRHARNLRIFDWVFKAVAFLVMVWLIIEAASLD